MDKQSIAKQWDWGKRIIGLGVAILIPRRGPPATSILKEADQIKKIGRMGFDQREIWPFYGGPQPLQRKIAPTWK